MYAKISIPIYVGNIILKIFSRMTYYQYGNSGKGTRFRSLDNNYMSLFIYFWSHNIGPEIYPQQCYFFSIFFLFLSTIGGRRGCGIDPPQPRYFIFIRSWLFWVDREVVWSNPHILNFFYFNSHFLPRGRGFDSHASLLFSFNFSLNLTDRLCVRIPLLSNLTCFSSLIMTV